MIPLTLAEIAALVGGTLHDAPDTGARVTSSLMFDSRLPSPGALFLALAGETRDGHDFARAAIASGATAVLATRPVDVPAVVVPDVLVAASVLTTYLTGQLTQASVIGLTGSCGKTSTKDLLAQLLPELGPTVATEASFNNEFGVPVTVSRADASTRFLVVEMGARGIGHIRYLTGMAPLETGIVLNVGSAHLGEFGTKEQIAEAKSELVESLPRSGWAVLNSDEPLVSAMASRTRASVILFGRSQNAQVRAGDVRLDDTGRASFTLNTPSGSAPVRLRLVGKHHVANALAAAAGVLPYGMTPQACADALSRAEQVSAGRMQVIERGDGLTVVNDAYNANPDSMIAALDALAAMSGPARRNPIAVLGPMLELGERSEDEHFRIGNYAAQLGIHVIAVGGPEAEWLARGADNAHVVDDREQAMDLLGTYVRLGDVVLFKASRDSGLRQLADAFVQQKPVTR